MTADDPGATDDQDDVAPDHDERIRDFFARHGGPGAQSRRKGESPDGMQGWSDVFAADGYKLQCSWSRLGSRASMQYSEIPPR
jgi:hypothetical protein